MSELFPPAWKHLFSLPCRTFDGEPDPLRRKCLIGQGIKGVSSRRNSRSRSGFKEPAPVGPGRGSPEPWGRSREVRGAGRLDGYGKGEEPDGASHAVLLGVETWQPAGTKGLLPASVRGCCRTAPGPVAATPRERAPRRTRMHNDIAEHTPAVKNKIGTLPLRTSPVTPSGRQPRMLRIGAPVQKRKRRPIRATTSTLVFQCRETAPGAMTLGH